MGDTAVAEPEQETDEQPEVAEAATTVEKLFQFSEYIHVGEGAAECDHREDGACKDAAHFHCWVCLPNQLQHRDIQEKARAARARRQRAMRDAGDQNRPASDAYVMLEAELDELMEDSLDTVLDRLAAEKVREEMREIIKDVASEEKYENYYQDAEEYKRLAMMPEDERPTEEWATLDQTMTEFGTEVEQRCEDAKQRRIGSLRQAGDAAIRDLLRKQRVEAESGVASINAYYLWLGYVCTHPVNQWALRSFPTLEAYRAAAPEVIQAIDGALQDLESRTIRGEAAGN